MAGSEALLQRLRSYSPISWFGKPPELSAPRCAAQGWRNTGPDALTCDSCGGKILCLLPPAAELGSGSAVVSYATQLTIAHDPACPWRKQSAAAAASAASALRFPLLPTATLVGSFRQRLAQLQQLEATPRVAAAVLQQLATAAQLLDPALLQALADLVELPLEALQHQQQAPVGVSSSQAALCKQQAQALLALCGWQVGQLLPPQLAADAARQSVFGVSHLLAPRSSGTGPAAAGAASAGQGQASLHASIGCGQATLLCDLCGRRVGLWQFSCSGPFYAQQLASRAAAIVAAADSVVAAHSPQPVPAEAGAGHTGPEQQQQQLEAAAAAAAAASPAVVASLQHTIAGGSLLSPSAAVPAAPGFSRGSPSPARASSGGFFRSPSPRLAGPFGVASLPAFGSSHLAGSPGFGAAASGGPFGAAAAAAGAFGEAAGGASDAAGAVFGICALKQEEQRAKQQQQQHVAVAGQAAGATGSGSMRPAGSGFLRSPSSSRAGADMGTSGSSSSSACFDPVAQHRSWCPWVHSQLEQAAAPGAGGAAGSKKGSLWHQGWSSTLLALLEEREDQQLLSGAAPAAGGAGSTDVMATARQVLNALG